MPALAAAAGSAVLLWLALPPADLGALAFVAPVPVLWAARGQRARRAALLGLVFGVTYFGVLMSWLLPITAVGWVVLSVGQGLWMAPLFAAVAVVWRDDAPVRTALGVAALWVAVEWLRGTLPLGGFTWGGLGYTQHDNGLTLPLASVLGVWGVSFVVMGVAALTLAALLRVGEGWASPARLAALGAAVAVAPAAVPLAAPAGPPLDVAVVQGSVPEELGTESRIIEDRIVAENHARVHLRLAADPPDLAVWPENALDRDPARDPALGALVADAVGRVGAPTLVGAITTGEDGRQRNENLLYAPSGRVVDRYAKNHLVPFGEYVPFRDLLEPVISDIRMVPVDFVPGDRPGRFAVPAGTFASVICFENSFPDLVRRFVTAETGLIVVSTNNATFGRSPAPEQHVVMSELRAVENGRWVVHAAISGVSALVDPTGAVVERTGLFEPALLRASVPQGSGRTPFNVIGGWLPAAFVLGAALALTAPRAPRRRAAAVLPPDPRVAVVLPTYDEAATVAEVVRGVLAAGERVRIVVVDDASPDGTAEVVRGLGTRRVSLIERPGKLGLASAYLAGFARALADGDDVIVEMDADLSHDPADLRALLAGARSHDLTIGSRYVPGGAVRNWSAARRALSRAGNLYARALLGLPVADATSGYRAYRREALRELLEGGVSSDGYAFQVELAYRAWRAGMRVGEVPITFSERRAGRSKLSRRIVLEALWRVAWWALRDRVLRRGGARRTGSPPPAAGERADRVAAGVEEGD